MPCDECVTFFRLLQDSPLPFEPHLRRFGSGTHRNEQQLLTSNNPTDRDKQPIAEPINVFEDMPTERFATKWWKVKLSLDEMLRMCTISTRANCSMCLMMNTDSSPTVLQGLLKERLGIHYGYFVCKMRLNEAVTVPRKDYIKATTSTKSWRYFKPLRQRKCVILTVSVLLGSLLMPLTSLEIDWKTLSSQQISVPKSSIQHDKEDTYQQSILNTIKQWLDSCDKLHCSCSYQLHRPCPDKLNRICSYTKATPPSLPDRVVEISSDKGGNCSARLCITDEQTTPAPYLTLSHRWGINQSWILTRSNLRAYAEKIPISTLPATFRDTITIAKYLGLKYIWIDSLCILQDDIEDWRLQSHAMSDIYRNSYATIAASWTTDDDDNCLFNHPPLQADLHFEGNSGRPLACIADGTVHNDSHVPSKRKRSENRQAKDMSVSDESLKGGEVITSNIRKGSTVATQVSKVSVRRYSESLWVSSVDQSPLNKRGWVLQERLLSRRVLHFCNNEVFFECRTAKACESYDQLWIKPHAIKDHVQTSSNTYPPEHPLHGREIENFCEHWQEVVEAYTDTNLTRPDDKLVAISGLAKASQATSNDVYYAGIWHKYLHLQLLWYAHQPGHVLASPYRAPTWSWAAVDSSVGFFVPSKRLVKEEILFRSIRTKGIDGSTNSFGELEYGYLSASGVLVSVQRCFLRDRSWKILVNIDNESETDAWECEYWPDFLPDGGVRSAVCLPIARHTSSSYEVIQDFVAGIVLQPTGDFDSEFRRIGAFKWTMTSMYEETFYKDQAMVELSIV